MFWWSTVFITSISLPLNLFAQTLLIANRWSYFGLYTRNMTPNDPYPITDTNSKPLDCMNTLSLLFINELFFTNCSVSILFFSMNSENKKMLIFNFITHSLFHVVTNWWPKNLVNKNHYSIQKIIKSIKKFSVKLFTYYFIGFLLSENFLIEVFTMLIFYIEILAWSGCGNISIMIFRIKKSIKQLFKKKNGKL